VAFSSACTPVVVMLAGGPQQCGSLAAPDYPKEYPVFLNLEEPGGEGSDNESDHGPPPKHSVARCAKLLKKLVDAQVPDEGDEAVQELLAVRPAEHWAELITEARWRIPVPSVFSRAALRLLRGRITLYEALCALGPEWVSVCSALQALAQQRLFAACVGGPDADPLAQPLHALLQAGASLLRMDNCGRVAAHFAAISGSDLLSTIVRMAPLALLIKDNNCRTPLDVLGERLYSEGENAITPCMEALADASLDCLAALPQQTSQVLHQNPDALKAWVRISASGGCAALLAAWDGGVDREFHRLVAEAQASEGLAAARLRQGMQRVFLLRELTSDHLRELEGVDSEELRLRLSRAEAVHREREEASFQQVQALEIEVRRLKGLVAEYEEELLRVRSCMAANGESHKKECSCKKHAEGTPALDVGDAKPVLPSLGDGRCEWEVVNQIRRGRLVGDDISQLPEGLRSGVSEMRASLTAAVDRLACDLYESEAHFVQELLQNADDNEYAADVVPTMRFVLRAGTEIDHWGPFVYSVNNECGLTETDVRSLCDISRSSKLPSNSSTTGYKGVGWKSVFRVCNAPHVLSRGWRFRFSASGLGMLTPTWIDDAEYELLPEEVRAAHAEGETVFFLPLTNPHYVPSIITEFDAIGSDAAQLLFLRRLQTVRLCSHGGHTECRAVVEDGRRIATLCQRTHMPRDIDKVAEAESEEITETLFECCTHEDVTVALPVMEEPPPYKVFAFLPVRPVGFHFAVNAPFHLTASRADLHRSIENLRRRDAIACAFLRACQANEDVAPLALKYLGSEPCEPFWLPVRTSILEGLKGIACVITEHGYAEPQQCVLRGDTPAAKWVTDRLLHCACGLEFASDANPREALRDLGVRSFGFTELCSCLRHMGGQWLRPMWHDPSRSTFYSDLYATLADALEADPARILEVQALQVFPVTREGLDRPDKLDTTGSTLRTAVGLFSGLCEQVPRAWQLPLVECLSPKLTLSQRASDLLRLLGVTGTDEASLEQRALRELLTPIPLPTGRKLQKATWAALAILRRCFLAGREPPLSRSWPQLRNAIALPSAAGDLLPPCRLRLWSFLGVEARLPQIVVENVYALAGVEGLDPRALECLARPPLVPDGPDWVLGWEVFLCFLGCAPVDPTGAPAEVFVEATLGLGSILSSGAFWQRAVQSPCTMCYLAAAVGYSAGARRRCWLRRLPIRGREPLRTAQGDEVPVAIKDLFLREAFSGVIAGGEAAGGVLPYMDGEVPKDSQVLGLIRSMGVAVEVNLTTLLKCLRWLRANDIQDIELIAHIYGELGCMGFVCPPDEKIMLVPGRGYLHPGTCSWLPFEQPLMQRCSPVEALSEHYSRFGERTRGALRSWVQERPGAFAWELCETLLQVIMCAEREGGPVPPREAADGLAAAATTVLAALGSLCASDKDGDAHSSCAANFFRRHRMIVVPSAVYAGGLGQRCTILHVKEAFWAVAPELLGDPFAELALQVHYGYDASIAHFFLNVVGVREELSQTELTHMATKASRPPVCRTACRLPGMPGGKGGADMVDVGLSFKNLHPSPKPVRAGMASSGGFDPSQVAEYALRRCQGLRLPGPRPGTSAGAGAGGGAPPCALSATTTSPSSSSTDAAAASQRGPGGQAAHLQGGPLRSWLHVGAIGGFPLYVAAGSRNNKLAFKPHSRPDSARLPDVGLPDIGLLIRLCAAFGMHPMQVAFAYDPSSRCVCQEHFFLDVMRIPRAAQLHADSAVTFWLTEFAHAVAHQGVGPEVNEQLLQVQGELVARILPQALDLERHARWCEAARQQQANWQAVPPLPPPALPPCQQAVRPP